MIGKDRHRRDEVVGIITAVQSNRIFLNCKNGEAEPSPLDDIFQFAADLKVFGSDGIELTDGVKSKELKRGAKVTAIVEWIGNAPPIVRVLRLS